MGKSSISVVVLWVAGVAVGCSSAEGQPQGGLATAAEPAATTTEGPASAEAQRVEVARLESSQATLELSLPGEVKGARDAVLGAAMGGFVEAVLVDNGDEVRRGQVLLRVDASSQAVRVDQARIEVNAAEREVRRSERLGDALAQAQRENLASRLDAARAQLRAAQIASSRAVVRAPFDGVVANLEAEVGEIAPPGAPLVRIVQLDKVKVTVSVSDRDVVALREGMPARVTTDAAAGVIDGVISHVNPAADVQTRSFLVDVEIDNPDRRVLPGMIAQVRVRSELPTEQLIIPQDFVVTKLDGVGVYVDHDGVAEWRPLELGSVVRNQVVVTSGLSGGERVVATGHRELADGDPLLVVREGVCCREGRVTF